MKLIITKKEMKILRRSLKCLFPFQLNNLGKNIRNKDIYDLITKLRITANKYE